MLDETIKKFYEVYEIEPSVRKGEKYLVGDFRLAEIEAEEDIMPKLYDYTYLRLLAYISSQMVFECRCYSTNELKEQILDFLICERLVHSNTFDKDKVREIVMAPMNKEVI